MGACVTKTEAIYRFWSGFDLEAYPTSSIPEEETFPYLSYENVIGSEGETVSVVANLWYLTSSEAIPNAKAEEISQKIGRGGVQIGYDGGSIWIKRGNPWCTSLSDESNPQIKRRMLNLELTFM